jgi:hypothetical protein
MKKIIFFILLIISAINACTFDNLEDLASENSCDTLNIDFETHIQPILQANCYACHGNEITYAGFNFTNQNNVVSAALSGRLSGAINHLSGFKPMPNGKPKLDPCKIKQIELWISSIK